MCAILCLSVALTRESNWPCWSRTRARRYAPNNPLRPSAFLRSPVRSVRRAELPTEIPQPMTTSPNACGLDGRTKVWRAPADARRRGAAAIYAATIRNSRSLSVDKNVSTALSKFASRNLSRAVHLRGRGSCLSRRPGGFPDGFSSTMAQLISRGQCRRDRVTPNAGPARTRSSEAAEIWRILAAAISRCGSASRAGSRSASSCRSRASSCVGSLTPLGAPRCRLRGS